VNKTLEVLDRCVDKLLCVLICAKELRSELVNRRVAVLGGEDRGDEQLKRVVRIELDMDIGVEFFEVLSNLFDVSGFVHRGILTRYLGEGKTGKFAWIKGEEDL